MKASVLSVLLNVYYDTETSYHIREETVENAPVNEFTELESNWDQAVDKYATYVKHSFNDDLTFQYISFDDMKLKPELLRGIYAYGYGPSHPSG